MKQSLIFVPILAHIGLVFCLYALLLLRKIKAHKRGEVDRKEAALNCKAWPDEVVKVSNNLDNQFEAPMLFYALCFIHFGASIVTTLTLYLAWFFVLTRFLHAAVHTGSNYVPLRMKVFAVGIVALVAMVVSACCHLI